MPQAKASSLIFTLYGDFGPERELWVGALVRLMGAFGFAEQAVRQAISRMTTGGWLLSRRERARAFYALTDLGRERVATLSPRIYEPAAEWDGRWHLLCYSVSEDRRGYRDKLRKDLALLGFAALGPGIWISPRPPAIDLKTLRNDAGDLLHAFSAVYDGPLGDRQLLQNNWDLNVIASAYQDFLREYEPRLAAAKHERPDDEAAFVQRLQLVMDFRRFLYIDPGLPSALLPAHWPGSEAARLFRELYALLQKNAQRFFDSVTSG